MSWNLLYYRQVTTQQLEQISRDITEYIFLLISCDRYVCIMTILSLTLLQGEQMTKEYYLLQRWFSVKQEQAITWNIYDQVHMCVTSYEWLKLHQICWGDIKIVLKSLNDGWYTIQSSFVQLGKLFDSKATIRVGSEFVARHPYNMVDCAVWFISSLQLYRMNRNTSHFTDRL